MCNTGWVLVGNGGIMVEKVGAVSCGCDEPDHCCCCSNCLDVAEVV